MSRLSPSQIARAAKARQVDSSTRRSGETQLASELQALAQAEDEKQYFKGVAALMSEAGGGSAFVYRIENGDLLWLANQLRTPLPPGLIDTQEVRGFLSGAVAAPEPSALAIGQVGILVWAFSFDPDTGTGLALFRRVAGKGATAMPEAVRAAIPLLRLAHGQWKLARELSDYRQGLDRACLFLDVIHQSEAAPTFRRSVQILAEDLRGLIGAEHLAIGTGNRLRCKLVAISSASKFDSKSQTTVDVNRLLREAVAIGSPVGWPAGAFAASAVVEPSSGQRELASAFSAEAVTAHPLAPQRGGELGALICFWKHPPSRERVEQVEAMSPHLAATLDLLQQAKPRGIRGYLRRQVAEAGRAKLVVPLVAVALLLLAMLLPVPHRIGASCWIDPSVKRQVAAPFDGILEKPFVQPGDLVRAGDVVAELDGKEIAWKLADADSRLASLGTKRTRALADDDIDAVQLLDLEMKSLRIERDHLDYQRSNLEVRSPIDGMVLTGDLEQSEGVPVQRGQRLFDISPIEELTVNVAVPGHAIRHVAPGMETTIRLESETRFALAGSLESIEPVSSIHDGKNVFIGRVALPNLDGRLRPGMRGRARVEAGKRRLGWVLFHRPWEYFLLHRPW